MTKRLAVKKKRTGLGALTVRQRQVYDHVRDHIRDHGRPPSVRELKALLRIRSTNGIMGHIRALERKQVLGRDRGQHRCLRLLVDEGITCRRQGKYVVLDCGERLFHLYPADAAVLGQQLVRLAATD